MRSARPRRSRPQKKVHIAEQEQLFEARHDVKQFSLQYLGDGDPNCGRAQGRKNRHEVLDRMSRLGTGLSPEQRNDWAGFKNEWDDRMLLEHGAGWVRVFASWLQKVLDELDSGTAHAFSAFVHSETRRRLDNQPGLRVPGRAAG